MSTDPIRLTREQLYELVWTKPMQQLAAEFGLSDVGLAQIYKRSGPMPSGDPGSAVGGRALVIRHLVRSYGPPTLKAPETGRSP